MKNILFDSVSYENISLSPYENEPYYRKVLIKKVKPGSNITNLNLHEAIYCMGLGTSSNNYFPKQSKDDVKIVTTNHDSTHGVRQILFLDYIINLLDSEKRKLIENRDILMMMLSVFFRSMGRVHEKKWDIKENNNLPSAEMFGAFIKGFFILGEEVTQDEINHYKALIENTCSTIWKDRIEKGSMAELQWHLMTMSHVIDLYRCWEPFRVDDALFRNHNEYFDYMLEEDFEELWIKTWKKQQGIHEFNPNKRPDLMYLKLK